MDENELNKLIGYGCLALTAMLAFEPEKAEEWLRKLPRAQRGTLKIALDDLDMIISRMGN